MCCICCGVRRGIKKCHVFGGRVYKSPGESNAIKVRSKEVQGPPTSGPTCKTNRSGRLGRIRTVVLRKRPTWSSATQGKRMLCLPGWCCVYAMLGRANPDTWYTRLCQVPGGSGGVRKLDRLSAKLRRLKSAGPVSQCKLHPKSTP